MPVSITDANGDQRELAIEYWRYEANGWTDASGGLSYQHIGGGFHPAGLLRWSDAHYEFSASYAYDDQAEAPDWALTQVGQMMIDSTPISRTLPAIVASFRERALAVTVQGGGRGFNEDIDLVLLLWDSGEEPLAL